MIARLAMLAFAALTLFGAALASGRLGEGGGVALAVGITLFVTGAIGIVNVIFFRRLKRAIDSMAEDEDG